MDDHNEAKAKVAAKCKFIVSRGPRKGALCGRASLPESPFCVRHAELGV